MASDKVLFLTADSMGRGDETLGRLLLQNYLTLAVEMDNVPKVICCVNSGVKTVAPDHPCAQHMQALEAKGARILLCGTCLQYFCIEDRITAGTVSNMLEIQKELLNRDVLQL